MTTLGRNPVTTITTFTISAQDPSKAQISANSEMTAAIVIKILAYDQDGAQVDLTNVINSSNLALLTNDTAYPSLQFNGTQGWCYTDVEPDQLEHTTVPTGSTEAIKDTPNTFTYYVYTDQMEAVNIYATLNLDGVSASTQTESPPTQVTITGVAPIYNALVSVTTDNHPCNIFANGNMQATVYVHILATDVRNNKVTITKSDLSGLLHLVDYQYPTEIITWQSDSGWSWTDESSGFQGNISGSTLSETSLETTINTDNDDYDDFTYYVSTTLIETKNIAAEATFYGKTYTTYKSQSNSYVTIVSQSPIAYDDSNTQITSKDLGNIADIDDPEFVYQQTNFYFSINQQGFAIFRIDISGPPTLPGTPDTPWSTISYLVGGGSVADSQNYHWIWEFSKDQQPQTVEVSPMSNAVNRANISGNDVQHALCLTVLLGQTPLVDGGNSYHESRVTIYDQYGNFGNFSVCRDEGTYGCNVALIPGSPSSKNYYPQ